MLLIFGFDVFDCLETMFFFGNVSISVIFNSFFIITFEWNGNFELWCFHGKDLVHFYQNIPYLRLKNIFSSLKINFLGEKMLGFLFKLLSRCSVFINSDNRIGKITSKSIITISNSGNYVFIKNCWKLDKLLRCRKAHSFQIIKDIDPNFDSTNWRLEWRLC